MGRFYQNSHGQLERHTYHEFPKRRQYPVPDLEFSGVRWSDWKKSWFRLKKLFYASNFSKGTKNS
jgi:hypothetical protein